MLRLKPFQTDEPQTDVCGAVPGALAGPSDQFALVETDLERSAGYDDSMTLGGDDLVAGL